MTQTITRLYDSYPQAQRAVAALHSAGLTGEQVSIVANRGNEMPTTTTETAEDAGNGAATGAGIGTAVGAGAGLLAGVGLLAIPGIGPVVAAGWLAATALGAVAGAATGGAAGGLIGALTNDGVAEEDAHVYAEGVRRGGALVTARVPDERVTEVNRLLAAHTGVEPAVRRAEYRQEGWQRFDETGAPYQRDPATLVAGTTKGGMAPATRQ